MEEVSDGIIVKPWPRRQTPQLTAVVKESLMGAESQATPIHTSCPKLSGHNRIASTREECRVSHEEGATPYEVNKTESFLDWGVISLFSSSLLTLSSSHSNQPSWFIPSTSLTHLLSTVPQSQLASESDLTHKDYRALQHGVRFPFASLSSSLK